MNSRLHNDKSEIISILIFIKKNKEWYQVTSRNGKLIVTIKLAVQLKNEAMLFARPLAADSKSSATIIQDKGPKPTE